MKLRRMEDSVRWFVLRFQPEAYNFEDYLVVCLNVFACCMVYVRSLKNSTQLFVPENNNVQVIPSEMLLF